MKEIIVKFSISHWTYIQYQIYDDMWISSSCCQQYHWFHQIQAGPKYRDSGIDTRIALNWQFWFWMESIPLDSILAYRL